MPGFSELRVMPVRSSVFGVPPSIAHLNVVPGFSLPLASDVRNVDVDPGVWVHPLDNRHLALQQDRSVSVEFRREGVVGVGRRSGAESRQSGERHPSDNKTSLFLHLLPLLIWRREPPGFLAGTREG